MKRPALARGPVKLRRSPLSRHSSPEGRQRPQEGRGGDWSPEVRATVAQRSQGRCEVQIVGVCTGEATDLHHRRRRREGDHSAANGLAACRRCHERVHRQVALSHHFGWIVSAWGCEPTEVPVFVGGAWVRFTQDGGSTPAEAPL